MGRVNKSDPRLKAVTIARIATLERQIDALIRRDIAAYDLRRGAVRASGVDPRLVAAGVSLKSNGFPDRRTRAYKDWLANGTVPAPAPSAEDPPPVAADGAPE